MSVETFYINMNKEALVLASTINVYLHSDFVAIYHARLICASLVTSMLNQVNSCWHWM